MEVPPRTGIDWIIVGGFIVPGVILSLGLSMGQWLCVPMVLGGIALWTWSTYRAMPSTRVEMQR